MGVCFRCNIEFDNYMRCPLCEANEALKVMKEALKRVKQLLEVANADLSFFHLEKE